MAKFFRPLANFMPMALLPGCSNSGIGIQRARMTPRQRRPILLINLANDDKGIISGKNCWVYYGLPWRKKKHFLKFPSAEATSTNERLQSSGDNSWAFVRRSKLTPLGWLGEHNVGWCPSSESLSW